MDEYAGRVLAGRYRLPVPPDAPEPALARALDTYSGQEVLIRQVPLPEVVEAELVDEYGMGGGPARGYGDGGRARRTGPGAGAGYGDGDAPADRDPSDPVVRRALEAATAAARIPDHPRLDQVFDVFAQDGSLWIVSELVPARPLAALLADRTLSPHRAAEIAADILTALHALHAHGWTHRNITPRTVLVCDDGRVVLTGLAAGAAEEALCGYDPVPREAAPPPGAVRPGVVREWRAGGPGPNATGPNATGSGSNATGPGSNATGPGAASGAGASVPGVASAPASASAPTSASAPASAFGAGQQVGPGAGGSHGPGPAGSGPGGSGAGGAEDDPRRARAGAIAAYRAGARAAAARTAHDAHASDRGGAAPEGGRLHDQEQRQGQGPGQGPGREQGQQFSPYRDHVGPANRSAAPPGSPAMPPGPPGVPQRRPGAPQGQPAVPQGRPAVPPPGGQGVPPGPPGVPQRPPGGAPRQGPGAPPVPRQPARPGSATYGGGLPGPVRRPQGGTHALPPGPAVPGARQAGPPPARTGAGTVPAPRTGGPAGVPPGPDTGAYPGAAPGNALAAERARQARITMVGAVTERWAPEQAGPVHANWQLAPPVGPAADLWALGALLFRSVQGHAPYPEDSAAELVQLVCSRAPAQAEELGALRPVVESLLRQDPTDRPDSEELRGWLRSLVRTAPEPDAGHAVVTVPALGRSGDPRRLPIVRRRGELVRRGRHKKPRPGRERPHRPAARPDPAARTVHPAPAPPARPVPPPHHHDGFRDQASVTGREDAFHDLDGAHDGIRDRERRREPRRDVGGRAPRGGPRRLGTLLLGLVLLLVVAAVLVAVLFLPGTGADQGGAGNQRSAVPSGSVTDAPEPGPEGSQPGGGEVGSSHSRTTAPAGLAEGFEMRDDPEGFRIAVRKGWQRHGKNAQGQVRYTKGDFTLLVVPGRDTAKRFGSDPMAYQQDKEAELAPFRDASWTSSSGLRRTDVGRTATAEGTFTWGEDSNSATYARNRALLDRGRYHVVLVIGPDRNRADVDRFYEQASASYRP
ncbi:protein kinase domain-containing protein [Streptomyces sclerotialus]|uniref:protein kinase domain-containing protein n=1 Tax=Streptomyces sclerotialus TaxID=1957 RepID=UPI0004CC151D